MFFEKFGDTVRKDETIADAVMAGQWDRVIDYVNREVFDKPEEYYTLKKLRQAAAVGPAPHLARDSGEGLRPYSRLPNPGMSCWKRSLRSSWLITNPTRPPPWPAIKSYFKAYATSGQVRHIVDSKSFADLATNPSFSTGDFRAVPGKYRNLIPEYVKDYVFLEPVRPVEPIMVGFRTPSAASTPPATSW